MDSLAEMTVGEAWEIVADLASQNVLEEKDCDGDPNLLECAKYQERALEVLAEFIASALHYYPDLGAREIS